MQQCLIYDSSLKFSRFTYGLIILLAFLTTNKWLVLAVVILMILGSISLKLNIPYEIHLAVSKKMLKRNHAPTKKELGEVNFVSLMTSALLLVGFLLIHYTRFDSFAWTYLLIVDLMIFLACTVGFCVATLMYVSIRKMFKN